MRSSGFGPCFGSRNDFNAKDTIYLHKIILQFVSGIVLPKLTGSARKEFNFHVTGVTESPFHFTRGHVKLKLKEKLGQAIIFKVLFGFSLTSGLTH